MPEARHVSRAHARLVTKENNIPNVSSLYR
jgi:hypothetical protein